MLPSQIAMDEMFDLDLALTMPDNDSAISNREADDEFEGAAHHLLDEMPTVVMAEGGQCAVCVEGGTAKRIPCGHVFHENCILRWISVNNSCPLCRQECLPPTKLPYNS